MTKSKPRLICFARDPFPLRRADTAILFGEHLSEDLDTTWCVTGEAGQEGEYVEPVGRVRVASSFSGKVKMHVVASREILRGEYDAVQCRDIIILSAWYALLAKLAKVPSVYWMSFPIDLGYLELSRRYPRFSLGRLLRATLAKIGSFLLYRWTLPNARMVFAQSDLMAEKLAARGIAAERIIAVPMGFSPARFRPEGETAVLGSIPADKRLILYVGTLDTERRLEVAFAGAMDVIENNPDVDLAIAGPASDADIAEIRASFGARGLGDRVHFLGTIPLDQLSGVIRRASVCLSPVPNTPLYDVSTPTKLVEYVACGRRAVANHLPDHDHVAGATGYCETVDFSPEGFRSGIEAALAKGAVPTQTLDDAQSWLHENRSYVSLADKCRQAYAKVFA